MFVKIVKSYRDTNMNLTLVPKDVILEVTDERAKELIESGVAKDFAFAIPVTDNFVGFSQVLDTKVDIENLVENIKKEKIDEPNKVETKEATKTKSAKKNK